MARDTTPQTNPPDQDAPAVPEAPPATSGPDTKEEAPAAERDTKEEPPGSAGREADQQAPSTKPDIDAEASAAEPDTDDEPPAPDSDEEPPAPAKKAKKRPARSAAAQARAVMQRRHLRIGLAMAVGTGAEVAGAAGLVVSGFLAWEWADPLWGRTDFVGVVVQASLAAAVIVLGAALALPGLRWRGWPRGVTVTLAVVVAAGSAVVVAGAPTGGRGAGGVVAVVAALLVAGGGVGWLVGLGRLRQLFPFGLADARARGYGNLAAVRRARLAGGPASAAGGAAIVAGALLVVPGLVSTEEVRTVDPLALTGGPPAADSVPTWTAEMSLVDGDESPPVWATPGGLVVAEERGARAVDPRDGTPRWHWRDRAYQRVATVVTDAGATLVLGLRYDAGDAPAEPEQPGQPPAPEPASSEGRDRVVALDTATGEVRWDRYDDDLVEAMGFQVGAPEDGAWFVVPQLAPPAPDADEVPQVLLRAVGSDDGMTRWQEPPADGCGFTSFTAGANLVVAGQECREDGADGQPETAHCLLTGLDGEDGAVRWSWPPAGGEDEQIVGCGPTVTPELVLVTYQSQAVGEGELQQQSVAALDPATGQERWRVDGDAEGGLTGLQNPVVIGDAVVDTQTGDDGSVELVVRGVADGELRAPIPLPDGQPIEVVAGPAGVALIPLFQSPDAFVLLSVDVAGETVRSEVPVATSPSDGAFWQAAVTSGPEALTMELVVATGITPAAPGAEPIVEDFTLVIHGW